MKLSISTLGCPDWGFDRVVQAFENLGVDIEVRGVDGEMEAGPIARFTPARAQALSLLATLQTPDYLPRACDRAHSAMEEMLDFLAPAELAALAALFERGGRFAAAEDALWAAENRAALAAFYRRLLAMDDAALCAGNLPREEILEAVRALEGDEGNAGS